MLINKNKMRREENKKRHTCVWRKRERVRVEERRER
jgi:hypothetical protein